MNKTLQELLNSSQEIVYEYFENHTWDECEIHTFAVELNIICHDEFDKYDLNRLVQKIELGILRRINSSL